MTPRKRSKLAEVRGEPRMSRITRKMQRREVERLIICDLAEQLQAAAAA
jgi:hypothetical protein